MQFSSIFFLTRPWHGPTTDDRLDEFPDGCLPSNHSTYGICERKNAISNTPKRKKITRRKIGRARGPRHVSETGNEVPGKHFSNNGHWLVCSVHCGTILLKPHIGTVYSSLLYLLSTTHSKDVRFPWVWPLYFDLYDPCTYKSPLSTKGFLPNKGSTSTLLWKSLSWKLENSFTMTVLTSSGSLSSKTGWRNLKTPPHFWPSNFLEQQMWCVRNRLPLKTRSLCVVYRKLTSTAGEKNYLENSVLIMVALILVCRMSHLCAKCNPL